MHSLEKTVHPLPHKRVPALEVAAATGYPIHMLGCGNIKMFCEEELAAGYRRGVQGIDSSVPFALGAAGKLLTPTVKKIPLGDEEQYGRLPFTRQCLSKLNIRIFEYWANTGEAFEEIPVAVARLACSEWKKYWAEGFATVEEVMKSCMFPAGWYAIRSVKRPGRFPREVGIRPLSRKGGLGHRELREFEDLLKIKY